jgi:hypothetical protein
MEEYEYINWLKQPRPEKLYHYTNKNSFLGIIQNKDLWASNILFQNDTSEIELSTTLLLNVLEQTISDIKTRKDVKKFFTNILNDIDIYNMIDAYTVSFSTKRDHLGQYRGYAPDPPGFCIEFNTKELFEHIDKRLQLDNKYYKFMLVKCIYDRDKQKEIIYGLIKLGIYSKNYDNHYSTVNKVLSNIFSYAPLFKSEAFEEEDEWRLILTNISSRKNIKERVGKSCFIPYYDLKFNSIKCFGDFFIGPCIDAKLVKHSVEKVCINNGITLNKRTVILSELPYRNW